MREPSWSFAPSDYNPRNVSVTNSCVCHTACYLLRSIAIHLFMCVTWHITDTTHYRAPWATAANTIELSQIRMCNTWHMRCWDLVRCAGVCVLSRVMSRVMRRMMARAERRDTTSRSSHELLRVTHDSLRVRHDSLCVRRDSLRHDSLCVRRDSLRAKTVCNALIYAWDVTLPRAPSDSNPRNIYVTNSCVWLLTHYVLRLWLSHILCVMYYTCVTHRSLFATIFCEALIYVCNMTQFHTSWHIITRPMTHYHTSWHIITRPMTQFHTSQATSTHAV